MEPKFQSSFIPKGPIAATSVSARVGRTALSKDFLSFVAVYLFIFSVVLAGGVFLYKLYLNYDIAKMAKDLENARADLSPEIINELTRLEGRIVSTEELIKKHRV